MERQGYEVTETDTADQVIREVGYRQHHVLVLDSSIPGMDPCELCRMLRTKSHAGIIVLAHHDTGQARIDVLNAGADDCLSAQFVPAELRARVRALLRRVLSSSTVTEQIRLHDRAIDLKSHKISGPGGRIVHLTPKEFLVLQNLVANANKPLSHENLSWKVWQRDGRGDLEYLRIVVGKLRRKLEPDPGNPRYILTERSVGYRFQMPLLAAQNRRPARTVSTLPPWTLAASQQESYI